MRRIYLFVGLLLVLTACVPSVEPTISKVGDVVTITLSGIDKATVAYVSAVNFATDDPRCFDYQDIGESCNIAVEVGKEYVITGTKRDPNKKTYCTVVYLGESLTDTQPKICKVK